jgi:hypothetical protein
MNKILTVTALAVLVVVITIGTVPQIESTKTINVTNQGALWVRFHFTDAADKFVPLSLIGSSVYIQIPMDPCGNPIININTSVADLLAKGILVDNQSIQIPKDQETNQQGDRLFFVDETGVIKFTNLCSPGLQPSPPIGQ